MKAGSASRNPRAGTGRAGLLSLVSFLAILGGVAILFWGTGWRVPQAVSPYQYQFIAFWEGSDLPSGRFDRPIGVATAPNGDLYVSDARQRIVHLDSAGRYINEWRGEGEAPGQFPNPMGLAVAPDGSVFVSDYELDRIQKFSPEGHFLLEFGSPGSEPGQFDAPAGLASDGAFVYVADFYNHRVQKFTAGGSFQQVIGHPGRVAAGALHYPTDVALAPDGRLIVADAYNYRLQWFNAAGPAIRRLGYHFFWLWPRPVSSPAGFEVPSGVAAAAQGLIHVADSGNHRVVMLSSRGARLAHWDLPDRNPNVYSPEHVAVSWDGATVYATDLSADRIVVLKVAP